MTINHSVIDILAAIDLEDLNTHNAERVEEGLPPLSIAEVYRKVVDLIHQKDQERIHASN